MKIQLLAIFGHIDRILNSINKELREFVDLSDEISHYQKFQTTLGEDFAREVNEIVKSILNAKSEEELKSDFESGKINIDEFMKNLKNNAKTHDIENYTISTTLREHYYNPLIAYNKNDKGFRVDFAISEYSEKILTRLEQFLQKDSKKLEKYEWCFSKLIKNIDNIYIPYFDSEMQSERKFYPNFIFWFKNRENGEYKIIFVDPKGLKIEINPRGKIKGFESIYKDKEFLYRDKKIRVYLFYYNKDIIKFYRFEKYKKSSVSNIMSNII